MTAARFSTDTLADLLRRTARPGMTQKELATLFGEDAVWERIDWGGSGRWRGIVTASGGVRAAFEFDAEDRLLGYAVVPVTAEHCEVAIEWLGR